MTNEASLCFFCGENPYAGKTIPWVNCIETACCDKCYEDYMKEEKNMLEIEILKALDKDPENVLTVEDFHEIFRDAWPRLVEMIYESMVKIGPVSFVCMGFDDPNWPEEKKRAEAEAATVFVTHHEEVDGWHLTTSADGTVRAYITHQNGGPMVVRFDPTWFR